MKEETLQEEVEELREKVTDLEQKNYKYKDALQEIEYYVQEALKTKNL